MPHRHRPPDGDPTTRFRAPRPWAAIVSDGPQVVRYKPCLTESEAAAFAEREGRNGYTGTVRSLAGGR